MSDTREPILAFQSITQRFPVPSGGPPLTVLDDIGFTVARGRDAATKL